jgi:hypothetical protein
VYRVSLYYFTYLSIQRVSMFARLDVRITLHSNLCVFTSNSTMMSHNGTLKYHLMKIKYQQKFRLKIYTLAECYIL